VGAVALWCKCGALVIDVRATPIVYADCVSNCLLIVYLLFLSIVAKLNF
jgi:hypothetical protein